MTINYTTLATSYFSKAQDWALSGLEQQLGFNQEFCARQAQNNLKSGWYYLDRATEEKAAQRKFKKTYKKVCDFRSSRVNASGVDYKLESQEPWFDSAPAKQETDEEDALPNKAKYHHVQVWSTGKCQSKNMSKWNRSGKTTRVLSNR